MSIASARRVVVTDASEVRAFLRAAHNLRLLIGSVLLFRHMSVETAIENPPGNRLNSSFSMARRKRVLMRVSAAMRSMEILWFRASLKLAPKLLILTANRHFPLLAENDMETTLSGQLLLCRVFCYRSRRVSWIAL